MTKQKHERWFTKKEASIAIVAFLSLMAAFTFGLDAQEIIKIKDGKAIDKKEVVDDKRHGDDASSSVEVSGYTRPGNPDDRFSADGKLLEVGFVGVNTQKFKVMARPSTSASFATSAPSKATLSAPAWPTSIASSRWAEVSRTACRRASIAMRSISTCIRSSTIATSMPA